MRTTCQEGLSSAANPSIGIPAALIDISQRATAGGVWKSAEAYELKEKPPNNMKTNATNKPFVRYFSVINVIVIIFFVITCLDAMYFININSMHLTKVLFGLEYYHNYHTRCLFRLPPNTLMIEYSDIPNPGNLNNRK